MPVILGGNIAVAHDTDKSKDMRRLTSKRQSRLCVYLHTAHSDDEEGGESVFKDSDVKNVLKEKEERKRKFKFDKLKLVWKGTYKHFTKSSKEAIQEFLDSRNIKKVRIAYNYPRGKSIAARIRDKSIRRVAAESVIASEKINSVFSERSQNQGTNTKSGSKGHRRTSNHGSCVTSIPQSIISRTDTKTTFTRERIEPVRTDRSDMWPLMLDESSVSQNRPSVQQHFVKRFSRSIFNTKKATRNQEHNLFLYRMEKKRQREEMVVETKTVTPNLNLTRTSRSSQANLELVDSNFEEQKRRSLDSVKAIEKAKRLQREKLVPELKDKIDVDTVLRAYLSEQFLELNLKGPEAAELRRVYKATIMDQPVVNNLINKHPDMLPSRIFKDLVKFKKGFEVNPIYSPTVIKAEKSSWRDVYRKTLSTLSGNVLIELETDMPQYANFYKTLFEKRNETNFADESWAKERKLTAIRENLLHMAVNLRISRQNPGSTARFEILRIFAAAGRNDRLLRQLGLSVEGWLDQLVKGLLSPFKSVRDETCQVLCLMTSTYPVMRELYLSKYFDVIQDLSLTIFRAIDQHEDTFPEYYILLAHIIHYCPSRSIIECIIERWSHFRCVGLILRWPRLLYYAFRYWPDDALYLGSRYFSIRVTKALEAALQRPLTAKVCRCALYYMQVRFHNVSRLFTIYFNKTNAHKSFFEALVNN